MTTREWTDEEVENMQKYGVCMICWEPRYVWRDYDDAGRLVEMRLTCPNGHRQ